MVKLTIAWGPAEPARPLARRGHPRSLKRPTPSHGFCLESHRDKPGPASEPGDHHPRFPGGTPGAASDNTRTRYLARQKPWLSHVERAPSVPDTQANHIPRSHSNDLDHTSPSLSIRLLRSDVTSAVT